jgi:ubiquitin carboxyl-terminal hydrolase 8
MTTLEIKEKAKDFVRKEARGATALTLIKTARSQVVNARTSEDKGDYRGALDAVTKAATLAQMFMGSSEFTEEKQPGKHGVLYKEFHDFISVRNFLLSHCYTELRETQHDGHDLVLWSEALESKLKETENVSPV